MLALPGKLRQEAFCSCTGSLPALRSAQRKPSGPAGVCCHLGGQGLENLFRETCVAHSDNSGGVPCPGSALPPQSSEPAVSGAGGQQLKGRILHHGLLHPIRATASSMGKERGWLRAALPAHTRVLQLLRWRSSTPPPSPGHCSSCEKQQQPHKPWWCHLSGFCTLTSGFSEMCLPPFWCCQPQGLLCETDMKTLAQGSREPETLSAIMGWGESGQSGEDQSETGPGLLSPGACRAPGVVRRPQLLHCLPARQNPSRKR